MRGWMIVGLGALALAGAGRAQDSQPEPGARHWSTGGGVYAYHQLTTNCESITHGHGRNAAWGLWRMPLAEILEDGVADDPDGGMVLRFRCADGSTCIASGVYRTTPNRLATHGIPFETIEGARRFAAEVADLKSECGIAD